MYFKNYLSGQQMIYGFDHRSGHKYSVVCPATIKSDPSGGYKYLALEKGSNLVGSFVCSVESEKILSICYLPENKYGYFSC